MVTLAGCVQADTGENSNTDVSAYLPEQNLTLWTMPLDQYMVTKAQSQRESYATALLTQECLDEQGFVNQVPSMSFVDDPDDLGIRDVFTPEIVSEFGYHSPGVMREENADWQAYASRPMSDGEAVAVDGCVRDVLDAGLVRYENQVLNFATGLAQSAFSGSLQAPEVKETATAWRECMAPRGVEDLPEDPSGMPSESLSSRFGLAATPDAGQTLTVTQEEIDLASFDAKCRQSSGYEQARYRAEWSRQVTLLAENLTALEDAKSQIADIDRSLSEVIASHAPAA
ncbi:hypothetical protein [Microbacterium suaedae]|uniref:hypothetical protein n=1 Tax=Microbacterium suaedae TaxID=2067813 RepID=UPI0013A618A5|nr:hypothetical protein [Microbacterium suaedae]